MLTETNRRDPEQPIIIPSYIENLPIEIRRSFIRKIITTVFIQLLVTCFFIMVFQLLAMGPLRTTETYYSIKMLH